MNLRCLALSVLILLTASAAASAQVFDVVIKGGRVMDPESGTDAVRNIGIRSGKIVTVSTAVLKGKQTLDATGLVVAPGFIDLHSHGQDPENYRYKAMDGVTTALEMEVGVLPVAPWYAAREGKSLVNFGATSGHIAAKMKVMKDTGGFLPRDNAVTLKATPAQVREVYDLVKQGLDEGALGIGFGINYVPTTSRGEILDLFKLAAERRAAAYVHMRFAGSLEPGSAIEALQEVLADAAAAGTSLHIVHLTSTCLRDTPTCLGMIDGARKQKLDVTTEAYPYTATATQLESAIYDEGWQQRFGITYKDLQWVATGERLTAETFARYRKSGGAVIGHSIPEEISKLAVSRKEVMVASDGLLSSGKGHPRSSGTFARVLGYYVREQKTIGLMDAISKMSLAPARRLEGYVPGMRNKGRIKSGADADIAIFDPATVIDKATFENPAQYSFGFKYVLVNGVPVVSEGKLVDGVFPGRAIRKQIGK